MVQEIPDEEKNAEAFEEVEESKEVKQMITQTMTKYYTNKQVNQQKVEAGVAIEPEHGAFPEKPETKPEEIKLVQMVVKEQENQD